MTEARPDRSVRIGKGDGCWRGQFRAMTSPCEILCETRDEAEAERLTALAATEAWRIEDKFSRYLPGNIVDRINGAKGMPVEVDSETAHLIDFSVTLHGLSEGRFDITSGILRKVWSFDGSANLPSAAAVAEVLKNIGWHRVSWASQTLQMSAGMQIDFGGIGKEYGVDCAADLLRQASPASCLINFGGDLAVTARRQRQQEWNIGIEALDAPTAIADRLLKLQIGALATSGDARRFLKKDGHRYGHILDPRTGWPVPDTPRSTTVAADTCTQAGMLSMLAMLEGEGAEAFLDAQGVRYWCCR